MFSNYFRKRIIIYNVLVIAFIHWSFSLIDNYRLVYDIYYGKGYLWTTANIAMDILQICIYLIASWLFYRLAQKIRKQKYRDGSNQAMIERVKT